MTTKTITLLGVIVLLILTYLAYPKAKTFFVIDSCLDQGGKWNYQNQTCDKGPELIQSSSSLQETLDIITFPCAVFVRPNSKKIEMLQKRISEDDYNTIVDDNEYYMATSAEYLDSVKVKRIGRDSEGILVFKTVEGNIFKMNLDSLNWGVLLFNGNAKPIEADITFINQDYETYMKK